MGAVLSTRNHSAWVASTALERFLVQRGLPVTPARWAHDTLLDRLTDEADARLNAAGSA